MKVYTSYYYKMANLLNHYVVVAISTSVPKWFPVRVQRIRELMPDWSIVEGIHNGTITEEEYTEAYNTKLATLNKEMIQHEIELISAANGGKDVVLCCYENSNKFCHRHLAAKWLDMDITELRT